MIGPTGLFAILMLVLMPEVHGHDCKDYKLTAADQSLVDMVKHYLHTSRKEECPKPIKANAGLWKEEIALSICTSINRNGHTAAVRRTYCSDTKGGNCNAVCKRENKSWSCFDAVHVYNRAKDALTAAHKYGSSGCSHSTCGPNVCCCRP